jgi:uncharacterized coiled-coil DUF342 family protein
MSWLTPAEQDAAEIRQLKAKVQRLIAEREQLIEQITRGRAGERDHMGEIVRLSKALREIRDDARSLYGARWQGGAREIAREALQMPLGCATGEVPNAS